MDDTHTFRHGDSSPGFRLNLLLLFFFITHSETPHVGTPLKHVEGRKGGNVTLHCGYQAEDISDIRYVRQRKSTHFSDIPACVNEEYKHESGRVCKTGACGIILKDLNFSDPGTYLLRFSNNSSPEELKFHLQVNDEISVKTGEGLHFDYLLINAERVERNSSGEWKEVWTIYDKKMDDRVIVRERNLIIKEFTVTDTGTYRVLDSNNETLITVSVTESGTGSDSKMTENAVEPWIIGVIVFGALALPGIIFAVYKLCRDYICCLQRPHRNTNHDDYNAVPRRDTRQ